MQLIVLNRPALLAIEGVSGIADMFGQIDDKRVIEQPPQASADRIGDLLRSLFGHLGVKLHNPVPLPHLSNVAMEAMLRAHAVDPHDAREIERLRDKACLRIRRRTRHQGVQRIGPASLANLVGELQKLRLSGELDWSIGKLRAITHVGPLVDGAASLAQSWNRVKRGLVPDLQDTKDPQARQERDDEGYALDYYGDPPLAHR
jgi:hypothetical protein